MASFNETRTPTSRKYVVKQSLTTPNWAKIFQTSLPHSSVFALQKQPEKLNFHIFLFLNDPLVATFNETCAPTSRKYVAEQGIVMVNLSKTFRSFWFHSSVYTLKKLPKNLNFKSSFTSNRPFGGYFQWNACTYFQKISSWTRHSNAKLIRNIWNFLVALLPFCFRKAT